MRHLTVLQSTLLMMFGLGLLSCSSEPDATPPASQPEPATAEPPAGQKMPETIASLEAKTSGLWRYTGLTTRDGTDLPLTGIFLFKDGLFLQQAVFNSEPFDQAGSMAHAGPYRAEPETGSMHLVAEQTISLDPTTASPISFTPDTDHDVTVTRADERLTLIFGMGTSTVQEFSRVGPGEGQLYRLENGALALVDNHFILVDGSENQVTSGYGTYEQEGESLSLQVIRWSEAETDSATNLMDVALEATFDGQSLVLADGRAFRVSEEP
ncbi:MAG: hypothetical protein AAF736_17135 [Pseudomonadota bacterium]